MIVEPASSHTAEAADAFVRAHPGRTPFHLSAWREVLARGYGFPAHDLVARDGETVRGVLPLALVRRPLGGRALISTPLAVYGGALASDAEARRALEAEAERRARHLGVAYLELRDRTAPPDPAGRVVHSHATFRKALPETVDGVLPAIPRKQRAEVRRAERAGVTVETDGDPGRFYPVYARSVRRLGSPVFPRRYFAALCDVFGPDDCEILTAVDADGPVASLITLYDGGWAMPYHAGGLARAARCSAYPALYAEAMRRAVARGATGFDFGRSPVGSGAAAFKRNWGFTPEPLGYSYALVRAGAPPDLRPDNPRLRPAVALWKRLPLPLANALGPVAARLVV